MTYKPQKTGEFGANLKQLIAERGLSDRQFAKQCRLEPSYISKLLNGGIAEPRRPTLEKLAQGLGCESIEQLYDEMQRLNSSAQEPGLLQILDRTPVSQADATAQLVRDVRSRLHPIITDPSSRIGTLRMLGINRPVLVDQQIYIDLNVLKRLSCEWHFSQWQQEYEPGDHKQFDRMGSGRVKQEGVDAIATVVEYPRLLVLGKPGAGKTTFLKALAVKCIQPASNLFADWVPLFVTLQEFAREARKTGSWLLVDYLVNLATQQGCTAESVREILAHGRSLLLMDGLDEVPSEDLQSVLEAVQNLQYSQNRMVITCRTQGHGATSPFWDAFTRVEVANLTPKQAERFIANWFQAADPTMNASLVTDLQQQLQEEKNKAIAELAVTPILLSLICAVFRDEQGTLPQRRSDLYAKGIRLLLERLQRSPIDPRLTFDKKEKFLATLALKLFQDNNYFPTEQTLVAFIKSYFQVEGTPARQILKAFETETGLLIERSVGYWSFSHLTFQEYFAALAIVANASTAELTTHIAEKPWREVFLLTTELLQPADDLLRLMKQQVDKLLVEDERLQKFLSWVDKKARSIKISYKIPYKLQVVRASFFINNIGMKPEIYLPGYTTSIDYRVKFLRFTDFRFQIDSSFCYDYDFFFDHFFQSNCYHAVALAFNLRFSTALESELCILKNLLKKAYENMKEEIKRIQALVDKEEENDIKQLMVALFSNSEDWKNQLCCNEQFWEDKFAKMLNDFLNFDQEWQFNPEQTQLLRQYYDANKLLVDCLNSDCYVSRSVREEIEETLLLPIAETE